MSRLIDELLDADLECLIPKDLIQKSYNSSHFYNSMEEENEEYDTFDEDDYSRCRHSRLYDEYEPDVFDIPLEYDNYNYDEYEECDECADLIKDNKYQNQPRTLEDMKSMFGKEDESDFDFLSHSVSELFGITKAQLKFIDVDFLVSGNLHSFIDFLTNKRNVKKFPDVQQRIKLAQLNSLILLDTGSYTSDNADENKKNNKIITDYVYNIALHKEKYEAISIIRLYRDYISMYHNCVLYNQTLDEDKRRSFPLNPKPSHLQDYHNKAMQDYRAYNTLQLAKNKEKYDSLIKEKYESKSYNKLFFKGKNFQITGPSCYDDFSREGTELDHCVETYAKTHAEDSTNIYFLRRALSLNVPFYTLEVSCTNHKYSLDQCFGYHNTTDKSDEAREFIQDWAKRNRIKINCQV